MNSDMNSLEKQLKGNIKQLIDKGKLIESKKIVDQYKRIVKNDIEIFSIEAVIEILQGNLDEAEDIIKNGLKVDNENYDLLYNLAYLFELKGEYNDALMNYKRARKLRYYDSTIKLEIDMIIKNIYENKTDLLQKEYELNEVYKNINRVENVLFIDFDLTAKVNGLASQLDVYGVNVDLAYAGVSPDFKFSNKELPYRKSLRITNIDNLVEYLNHYCYDIVHLFNISDEINSYIKEKSQSAVIINNDLLENKTAEVIKFYSLNKKTAKKKNTKHSEKENLTILVPTYNRPKYLQRLLTYFNSFQGFRPYIFVLDSSFEENRNVNETTVESFNNEKIKYYSFNSSINFYKKVNFGVEKIKTDYVALCADDDFLAEEGLKESINALERDKGLYSVKGKNLYFIETMAKLKEYDFFEGLYQENEVVRLKSITKGFVPSLIYQVFRVSKFKKMYSFLENNLSELPSNPTFSEYLSYFMVICTGKIGKINVDLNIRDKSVPRAFESFKNFPHAILDGSFNDNYDKFCSFLAKYVEYIGGNKKDLENNLDEIFLNFLVNFLQVPKERIILKDGKFDIRELEIGMRKSWVWPIGL